MNILLAESIDSRIVRSNISFNKHFFKAPLGFDFPAGSDISGYDVPSREAPWGRHLRGSND